LCETASSWSAAQSERRALENTRLLAPVTPRKYLAIGLN
jgi:hypothetical protein